MTRGTIDYRAGAPGRSFRQYCMVYAILVAACGGSLLFLMTVVVPGIEMSLLRVKITPSALMAVVFGFSQILTRGFWIVALAAMIPLPFLLARLTLSVGGTQRRLMESLIYMACVLGTAAVVALVVAGILMTV